MQGMRLTLQLQQQVVLRGPCCWEGP